MSEREWNYDWIDTPIGDGPECTACEGFGHVEDESACSDDECCCPVRACPVCQGWGTLEVAP